jgi:hypothetical protein
MTVESADRVASAAAWTAVSGLGDVRVGAVAPVRRVTATADTGRLSAAVAAAVGRVELPFGVADVCPDPLVFAVDAGLPRLAGYVRSIDGGSSWTDEAPPTAWPLYAVSQITEMAERRTGDGRSLVRVVYRIRFTDACGAYVGAAEGVSIHVGAVA